MSATRPRWLCRALEAMEVIAPLRLAAPWDNVGLLIDSMSADSSTRKVVFLTNDLTDRVVGEAVRANASLIITYHPTPFSGMKKITSDDRAGRVVLQCARAGIAVYSPHTALDCVLGGVNDWLAAAVCDTPLALPPQLADAVKPVTPHKDPVRFPGAGDGRIVTLPEAVPLGVLVARIKANLKLTHLQLSLSDSLLDGSVVTPAAVRAVLSDVTGALVSTVAVCAGSGQSVLKAAVADVWLTGELGHHECVAAASAGTSVLLTNHSNSERGYLTVLQARLSAVLGDEMDVLVSELDADPLMPVLVDC